MEDGVLLDGWLLALDEGGWLDTDLLRRRLAGDRSRRPPRLTSPRTCSGPAGTTGSGGRSPHRRERLEAVLRDGDRCVVSHALRGEGTLLAEALARFGLNAISRTPARCALPSWDRRRGLAARSASSPSRSPSARAWR